MYDAGNVLMEASCHHKKRAANGACGGCYARAIEVIKAIANAGEVSKASDLINAIRAEAEK